MERMSDATSEWETEALPVLRWVKAAESGGCLEELGLRRQIGRITISLSDFEAVAAQIGLSCDRFMEQCVRLIQNGLLHGHIQYAGDPGPFWFGNVSVTADGLRAIGTWPGSDLTADAFRVALEGVLHRTTDAERRGHLEAFRDTAAKLGWELVVEAMKAGIQATVSGAFTR